MFALERSCRGDSRWIQQQALPAADPPARHSSGACNQRLGCSPHTPQRPPGRTGWWAGGVWPTSPPVWPARKAVGSGRRAEGGRWWGGGEKSQKRGREREREGVNLLLHWKHVRNGYHTTHDKDNVSGVRTNIYSICTEMLYEQTQEYWNTWYYDMRIQTGFKSHTMASIGGTELSMGETLALSCGRTASQTAGWFTHFPVHQDMQHKCIGNRFKFVFLT